MRTGRLARWIGWSLAAFLVAGVGAAASAGGQSGRHTAFRYTPAASVRISVNLSAQRKGTFAITGTMAATGTGTARRTVSGQRLVLVETLKSSRGTLVLRVEQLCAKTTGKWRVLAATAAYSGAAGNGTTTMRSPCLSGPLRVVHAGTLTIPPPPTPSPAPPSKVLYGGWTAQDEDVSLEVTDRTITLIQIGEVSAPCAPNAGPTSTPVQITDPIQIAADGTFTAVQTLSTLSGPFGTATVTGRFAAGTVEGTVSLQTSYAYPPAPTRTCSASGIPWNATAPPPPPRLALSGTYCGFTNQGKSICIDVGPDGRTVTSVRDGLSGQCRPAALYGIGGTDNSPFSLRPNLHFSHVSSATLSSSNGSGSARHYVYGSFDTAGTVTGTTRYEAISIVQDGTTYTCAGETATFDAKLQR